tara:strand:- start:65 stop:385 length:321 start_codon:yes stop_codon:yes gene_type:complete
MKVTENSEAERLLCCALADLEGILPQFEPDGDRTHPGWQTIKELREHLDKEVETVAEARATGEYCVFGTIRGVKFCVENSEATEGISIDAWVADSPWINVPVKGLD